MRSRKKAYQREMEEMDAISQMYKLTLKSLGWTRQRQEQRQHQQQQHRIATKKRGILDDDSADDENGKDMIGAAGRRHPTSSYNTWKEATLGSLAPAPSKPASNIITIPKNSSNNGNHNKKRPAHLREDTVTDSQTQDDDQNSTDYSEAGAPAMEDIYNPAPLRHRQREEQAVSEVQLNAS